MNHGELRNQLEVFADGTSVDQVIESLRSDDQTPMFIFDAGDVIEKLDRWRALLPRIEPFYAVKCNNANALLRLLAAFQVGFDCATPSEIESVLQLEGVDGERVVFANPCKAASWVRYAKNVGVRLTTFDNETELVKLARHYPEAR